MFIIYFADYPVIGLYDTQALMQVMVCKSWLEKQHGDNGASRRRKAEMK